MTWWPTVTFFTYRERHAHVGVQHAVVLHIGAPAHGNGFGVAPYHHAEPDAAVLAKVHIADDLGVVGHPGGFVNGGGQLVQLVEGHDLRFSG
jgi:hypothetical protein